MGRGGCGAGESSGWGNAELGGLLPGRLVAKKMSHAFLEST